MYLKAASQEGTNIASSPPLRLSYGRLSQSRGRRKCTALSRKADARQSFLASRVFCFPKVVLYARFLTTACHHLSYLCRQRVHQVRMTSTKIARCRVTSRLSNMRQQSCFTSISMCVRNRNFYAIFM